MADDIVARLRGFHPCCGLHCDGYGKDETVPDCIAAADEIERLREALITISELDYHRAAVNGCAHTAVEIARAALAPEKKHG